MGLRHALRADLPTIADVWVDAFACDPYLRWLQPDDLRWPDFGRAWMPFIVERTFERGHTYLDDGADVAVAWIPPDLSFVGPDDVARGRAIIASAAGEARADEAVATVTAARDHAPEEPHWTLRYLGVRSARHGSGLGMAAVAPMLEVCDREGMPCGLVSNNPRNVPFLRTARLPCRRRDHDHGRGGHPAPHAPLAAMSTGLGRRLRLRETPRMRSGRPRLSPL